MGTRLIDALDPERVADRAGGDDQGVVLDGRAVVGVHQPAGDVDVVDASHAHHQVALPTEDAPHCVSDVVGVQARGGHLVEQRLKRVEVVRVDQRDVDRCAPQPAHRVQAAEAGADHHNTMPVAHAPARMRSRATATPSSTFAIVTSSASSRVNGWPLATAMPKPDQRNIS